MSLLSVAPPPPLDWLPLIASFFFLLAVRERESKFLTTRQAVYTCHVYFSMWVEVLLLYL